MLQMLSMESIGVFSMFVAPKLRKLGREDYITFPYHGTTVPSRFHKWKLIHALLVC